MNINEAILSLLSNPARNILVVYCNHLAVASHQREPQLPLAKLVGPFIYTSVLRHSHRIFMQEGWNLNGKWGLISLVPSKAVETYA